MEDPNQAGRERFQRAVMIARWIMAQVATRPSRKLLLQAGGSLSTLITASERIRADSRRQAGRSGAAQPSHRVETRPIRYETRTVSR